MGEVKIVEYEEKYHSDFKRLSYEWLEEYVSVEPEDEIILNNPKEVILDNGGFIFFAKFNEEIVGTVSLIRVDEYTFELAKLAVTKKYQGLKIGKKLMEKCLYVAKQKNAQKVILYTSHILTSAIELYKRFDFKEVPLINNKYIESDLKMELKL
ncbi:GNAT family N-acetyltransferase [Alkaliphilus peptidifermentans]|uniref:Ribosomal protein S18 acetylase RimI n=1 Tax=Alkaliphilus peptidifermentans DSM 18978 TaxID=1120976 RepID=A0A1G5GX54_9FIRM|nr:GNAT family N-acetyltransferase [Alkaliphilus peptidifermentans]SCY56126.1 Ribosomal protein S18 acetylase RimI [Alkaliphilus peptidifermentans DSM 18978]